MVAGSTRRRRFGSLRRRSRRRRCGGGATPRSRATRAAASRVDRPSAERGGDVGVDLVVVGLGRGRRGGQRRCTCSPRGSVSSTWPTAASSGPRHTSSCSLVSSRATATSRSGPHAPSSCVRVACTRRGDSKSTTVRASGTSAAIRSRRSRPAPGQEALEHEPVGREPREHERREHRARPGHDVDRRARPATQARTRRSPGSEMPGMPASVTYATHRPVAHRVDDPVGALLLVVLRAPPAADRRRGCRRG